jgi:hypothetical protein
MRNALLMQQGQARSRLGKGSRQQITERPCNENRFLPLGVGDSPGCKVGDASLDTRLPRADILIPAGYAALL